MIKIIFLYILMDSSKCAPGVKYTEGSCYDTDTLMKIFRKYNEQNPRDHRSIIPNRENLIDTFKSLMSECPDQKCWVDLLGDDLKNEILNKTFKPYGPRNSREWLSTIHIDKIMNQYEQLYPEFIFLGAVPIDFYSIRKYLKMPIPEKYDEFDRLYKDGKTKLGIVFNLDEHYKSGSHWTASFIDFENPRVYYFDSVSTRPEERIIIFLIRCIQYIIRRKKISMDDIDISHNPIQHQWKDSECGVYSCNFLIRLLNGYTYDSIIMDRMNDDEMQKCRQVYFY